MDSNIVETEKVLPQAIYELTSNFKGVMCIDSFSVEALQTAIESYPGRPIINSISLEEYKKGVRSWMRGCRKPINITRFMWH
ncbi:MAG: hypothetical protein CM1200mP16_16360 [Nitrospina sp.]|nr:MAG: hypothetical protein CM1200mP16_16360 [Nitrospina sp.]